MWIDVSVPTHTVTFDANGGTGTAPLEQTVSSGSSIILPGAGDLLKSGFIFGGWNTNIDGTGVNSGAGDSYTVTSAVTFYARWINTSVTSYTITFHANGGGGTTPSPQVVNTGTKITLPDGAGLSRNGYDFAGWSVNSTGTGANYAAGAAYTVAGYATFYARWTATPVGCGDFEEGTEREHFEVMKKQFCDERDGKKYVYVTMGGKDWMAENLNYEVPKTGSDSSSYCYDNTPSNCETYGRLYNWPTAMVDASSSSLNPSGVQGICPFGWHLPSLAEWDDLIRHVDPSHTSGDHFTAGSKLKSQTGCYTYGGISSTDEYGFSALPGGNLGWNGNFGNAGYHCRWWSATEYDATTAWTRLMHCNYGYVYWNYLDKSSGFSVRCVRD